MTMNLIPPVSPVNSLPRSKHSTEDPNERRRRQLMLTYGVKSTVSKRHSCDTVEISSEGRRLLAESQKNK